MLKDLEIKAINNKCINVDITSTVHVSFLVKERITGITTPSDINRDYYVITYATQYNPGPRVLKILKSDLETKGWEIDGPELLEYIKSGLKILVGFDFDLTLSNIHSFYPPYNTGGLKGGDLTKEALEICANNPNLHLFIATNNEAEKVQGHLKNWKIDQYFNCVKGREAFHDLQGDKEICFQQVRDTLLTESAVHSNGMLNLDSPGKPIDVVAAVLIDDQCFTSAAYISHLQEYCIRAIPVNPAHSNIEHLRTLNKDYLNNNLDPALIQHEKLQKTTDLVQRLMTHSTDINDGDFIQFDPKIHNVQPSIFDYADGGVWSYYHDLFETLLDDCKPADVAKEILNRLHKSYPLHSAFKNALNQKSNIKQTLLHFFATTQDHEAIQLLVEAGADLMSADEWGNTCLHLLMGEGDYSRLQTPPSISLIKYLIQSGANFNICNNDGKTLQDFLVSEEVSTEALQLAAYICLNAGVTTTVEEFLVKNNLTEDDKAAFLKFYEDQNIVKQSAQRVLKLITHCKDGVDEEDGFKCPGLNGTEVTFEYADGMWEYYHDLFIEVLDGVAPADTAQQIMSLLLAECEGDVALVKQKLNEQGIVGQTLLHLFATSQDEAAIRFLINIGADINRADMWDFTPLHTLLTTNSLLEAEKLPSITLLQYLIDIGADFNALNDQDMTFQDVLVAAGDSGFNLIAHIYSHAALKIDIQEFMRKNGLNPEQKEKLLKYVDAYAPKTSQETKSQVGLQNSHLIWKSFADLKITDDNEISEESPQCRINS